MSPLRWLPEDSDWSRKVSELRQDSAPDTWLSLCALANAQLGFTETLRLDRAFQKRFGQTAPESLTTQPIRLAILGSGTVEHLIPGIRVAGSRRNLWITTYTADYGQYLQELLDPTSPLHQFHPNAVLFALDAPHLFGAQNPASAQVPAPEILDQACSKLATVWRKAREGFSGQIIQQTLIPTLPPLLGQNEHRFAHSLHRLTSSLNERLRSEADAAGVDLLALDDRITLDGLTAWHDPQLWHKAKQEISPLASPFYGDLVARLLAAGQGRSAKCLVLDLDNTLWGGMIGDDGLEGIKLGQGSPQGEAFLAFQRYALGLSARGIILAVCSKNDEANALLPFEKHPEMVLRRSDIACFVANWNDKAANLREIARRLNIGLDALVFVDDNPFERNIVRRVLPMVAVPELPDDPALFPQLLSDAGYFEALHLTPEDFDRTHQYQSNLQREELKASTTDLEGYLRDLQMELEWSSFQPVDLQRVVQLINKTNQFNLTTRRRTETEVLGIMANPLAFTLQLRLKDRFGDNGIIGIVIAQSHNKGVAAIDTWLMSCRVLGRGVEDATLALIVNEAKRLDAHKLVGEYRPTVKNGMVREHFGRMGFTKTGDGPDQSTHWELPLENFIPRPVFLSIKKA